MRSHAKQTLGVPSMQAKHLNGVAKARTSRRRAAASQRVRGLERNEHLPFIPPEDWHEPQGTSGTYRIVVQPPGNGYRHIVTPQDVQDRLNSLPKHFINSLEVVQFSRMTHKKRSFPCYGMQWGNALYLYPLEETLVEDFDQPPRPNFVNETRMYGARWKREAPHIWRLVWTARTIKDFYLNNVLIHELGHLLDERNASYLDRERYAEWFAVQHGYLPTKAQRRPGRKKRIRRRHHAK